MVLDVLTAVAACPAIIGTTEAVRQGQKQSAKEKHRGLKTNIIVNFSTGSKHGREIDGCEVVVLSDNKVRCLRDCDPFREYMGANMFEAISRNPFR